MNDAQQTLNRQQALSTDALTPAERAAIWIMKIVGGLLLIIFVIGGAAAGDEVGGAAVGAIGGLLAGVIIWAAVFGFASIVQNVAIMRSLKRAQVQDDVAHENRNP